MPLQSCTAQVRRRGPLHSKLSVFACVGILICAANARAQVTISTMDHSQPPAGDRGDIGIHATASTSTFYSEGRGELFQAPTGNTQLDALTFYVGSDVSPPDWLTYGGFNYRAYLLEWDPTAARPASTLWVSDPTQDAGVIADVVGYTPVTFETGGIQLQPDRVYAAVLMSIGQDYSIPVGPDPDQIYMQHVGLMLPWYPPNPVEMDGPVFAEITGNLFTDIAGASITDANVSWTGAGPNIALDASFSMTPTPEPSTVVLMATGLLGVCGIARRSRTRVLGARA